MRGEVTIPGRGEGAVGRVQEIQGGRGSDGK